MASSRRLTKVRAFSHPHPRPHPSRLPYRQPPSPPPCRLALAGGSMSARDHCAHDAKTIRG